MMGRDNHEMHLIVDNYRISVGCRRCCPTYFTLRAFQFTVLT